MFIPDRNIDFALERLQVAVGGASADAKLLREVIRPDSSLANRLDILKRAQQPGGAVALGEVFSLSLGNVQDCATPHLAEKGGRAAA